MRRAALASAVLLGALACADDRPVPTAPNILFVLVDTLRADRVGAYGNERDTTPFLDRLARDGLLFENAISQSPWTGASMASLWTSRVPSATGVGLVPDASSVRSLDSGEVSGMIDDAVTLAEVLHAGGYQTLAVCTNPYASDRYGVLRGFSDTRTPFGADAREVVDAASEILADAMAGDSARPVFLYVHFMDVHEPTDPVAPYDTMFPTLDGAPHLEFHEKWGFVDGEQLDSDRFARYRSHKLALYDGALRYVDDQVKRLHQLVDAHQPGHTVTVVASDHGEEFWDHADFEREHDLDPRGFVGVGHGHTMFRELLRTPLVFHGPGVPRQAIATQVRNLDVMPTVLGLAGSSAGASDAATTGLDLIGALTGGTLHPQLAFSEDIAYGPEAKSVQNERYQYVEWADADGEATRFLFDKFAIPPADAENLLDQLPEVAATLRQDLHDILAGVDVRQGPRAKLDPEALEALRALGYVR